MCRLLGVVSGQNTRFRFTLEEAPRSLSKLSTEHPHGWGVAVFNEQIGWLFQKHTGRAADHPRFREVAECSGALLLAHIRKRTVGPESEENTHPFKHGRWIFAHNGTIKDLAFLRAQVSEDRKRSIMGETDSELLFAFLLTKLDRAGLTDRRASSETDGVLKEAVHELWDRADLGPSNFLLTDGEALYAHRNGRELFLLQNTRPEPVRASWEPGALFEAGGPKDRSTILIASERITDDDGWVALEETSLIRVDRRRPPNWSVV
jgi:predicted glutamine amidotransferase